MTAIEDWMELQRIEGMRSEDDEDDNHEDDEDDDHDEEEAQSWPPGLLPTAPSKLAEASAASTMVLPSCTSSSASSSSSSSSSDFDEESTITFCPENSTSLGTLIGIHSSSQLSLMQDLSLEERRAGIRRDRHRRMCSLLGCGVKIEEDLMEEDEAEYSIEATPAPSRYWSMDRREITRSAPNSIRVDVAKQKRKVEETIAFYEDHTIAHRRKKSWPQSHSCSPSLRVNSKKPGPISPQSAFFPTSHNSSTSDKELRISFRRNRLHSVWLALCTKLRSRLAIWSL